MGTDGEAQDVHEGGGRTPLHGLSAAEVAERVAAGQVNTAEDKTSRTLGEIVRANVLTRFNAILAVLATSGRCARLRVAPGGRFAPRSEPCGALRAPLGRGGPRTARRTSPKE